MGDIVRRKFFIGMTAVIGLLLLITALLCINSIKTQLKTLNINALRNDAGEMAAEMERTKEYQSEADLSYAVILNDGTIAYNNGTSLRGHINLHTLGSANT
ncbi:MAG TPA: hypothetical protein VJY54_07500, partial [Lachnospiraceae bacterium]|nr:hypothetical protein [Lachnospiraceae bacterium]